MEYAVYMSGAHQQDELLHAESESFFSVSVLSSLCMHRELVVCSSKFTLIHTYMQHTCTHTNT